MPWVASARVVGVVPPGLLPSFVLLVGSGPWLLALDRTCWKFGRYDINILMLAIIHKGIAIPVMWDVLGRAGTSTTAQRSALLSRFCAVFGEAAIAGLIADREFIGTAWMRSLAERDIPFILRIKDTFHVRLSDRRQCQVRSLFRKVGVGGDATSARTAGLDHATARSDRH